MCSNTEKIISRFVQAVGKSRISGKQPNNLTGHTSFRLKVHSTGFGDVIYFV